MEGCDAGKQGEEKFPTLMSRQNWLKPKVPNFADDLKTRGPRGKVPNFNVQPQYATHSFILLSVSYTNFARLVPNKYVTISPCAGDRQVQLCLFTWNCIGDFGCGNPGDRWGRERSDRFPDSVEIVRNDRFGKNSPSVLCCGLP